MTAEECRDLLRSYNAWRRGDKTIEQPSPASIGAAIDCAVERMGRLADLEHQLKVEMALSFRNQVADLEDQRDDLRQLLFDLLSELGERDQGDGNAPGHCHEKPGIWDADNGKLAGKPCAWCAIWNKAKELRGGV